MSDIVQFSSKKFLLLCIGAAAIILGIGSSHPFSSAAMAIEVFLTVIALFVFGSIKYQIDKNALTYGAVLIIGATFATGWWPESALRQSVQTEGWSALLPFIGHHVFSFRGLDHLIHADTMLFILGLTFFVAVIAQTRILEAISFAVLKKNNGAVLPTVGILIALVSFASGILDGVSMIGLLIRTLVIILVTAKINDEMTTFAVIISTVVTTVCGMWLAYGEPPNLIMKANLHPYLTDGFFLRYCLPAAVASFLVVYWNIHKQLKGHRIDPAHLAHMKAPALLMPPRITALCFVPFVGLLVWHALDHSVPLFWSSCAGFAAAFTGIYKHEKARKAALHEATHEYKEYLFLFPLFLSITLLQKSGFFDQISDLVHRGIEAMGMGTVAFIQYAGAVVLSALLDNNVVADFASRGLRGLEIGTLHLFAMAQIAGYAVGGCWTHIGSAQSVVAFSFIKREIHPRFSPFKWIKMMTPVIIEISILMILIIYAESFMASLNF